jgi:hypothetical protein
MKATAWIAAAAMMFGTAAFAQQHEDKPVRRDDDTARAQKHDHASEGAHKANNGLHRLAEKTRHAFHRAGEKMHHMARRDDANDTRAMGASGDDSGRRGRMDEAYSHWQSRHDSSRESAEHAKR